MLTRRLFATCALCAFTGLKAEDVSAQDAPPKPTPGVKRKILRESEGPVPGTVTLLVEGEIGPDAFVARHTHPGIESAYILEGAGTLSVQGQPDLPIKAGEGYHVARAVPHALQNGPATMRIAATYIVDKGKPLASPVPG